MSHAEAALVVEVSREDAPLVVANSRKDATLVVEASRKDAAIKAHDSTTGRYRSAALRASACGAAVFFLCVLTGCSEGVAWRLGRFEDVFPQARDSGKPAFVYFRNWYSVECTRFEENVLKQPAILAESAAFFCIPLDFDYDRSWAERWGVRRSPAYVILDRDQHVLGRGEGEIGAEELLAAMQAAKAGAAKGSE